MDLAVVQDELRLAIARASGVADSLVQWANAPQAAEWCEPGEASIALKVQGLADQIGEERRVSASRVVTLAGNRTLRVQVRIEVLDQQPGHDSVAIAARLRTALRGRPTVRALQAVGLALVSVQPTIHADFANAHRRVVSVALVELRFNLADNLELSTTDPAHDPGPWIERVGIAPQTPIEHPAFEVP